MAPDLILSGGSLFTAGMSRSRPGAVAVTAGRISAVGTDDDVLALRGPRTQVIDARGRLLIPGFQDAHVHPVMGGVEMTRCDVHACESAEEILAAIVAFAAAHPDEPRAGPMVSGGHRPRHARQAGGRVSEEGGGRPQGGTQD